MKIGLLFLLAATLSWSQAAPEFEVASVKVVDRSTNGPNGSKIDNSYLTMNGIPLKELVATAYGVWSDQVTGPDWMTGVFLEIRAKLPPGATEEQVPVMLRKMLHDRFNAAIRVEQKEQPVYLLTAGKNVKLTPAAPGAAPPEIPPDSMSLPTPLGTVHVSQGTNGGVISAKGLGALKIGRGRQGGQSMEASAVTMKALAAFFSTAGAGRPVIDKTGLEGAYNFSVDMSMLDPGQGGGRGEGGPASASTPGTNPLMLIVEAIGLKLESGKAPVETVTVDKLDKTPSEN